MIIEVPREELVAIGSRIRTGYLIEQAGYTLGVAAADGKALTDLLPDGFLAEVQQNLADLDPARQDRALLEAESKDAGRGHTQSFHDAKVWRRTVAGRAILAKRMGKNVPDELVRRSSTSSGPALTEQVVEMVRLLEANLDLIPGAGKDELLAQGKTLVTELHATETSHEVKRLNDLPDSVQALYVKKALVYTGLKMIHDAGRALHAADPLAAARYNLGILHRKAGNRTAAPAPAPTPAPEPVHA
ncbi:MAG: hypothetical protein ACHQQS_10415 [Thermoanaerobaculales bacterium]